MLKVKPSRFHLVVETYTDGSVLLFNTFSAALCVFSERIQRFLNEAQV